MSPRVEIIPHNSDAYRQAVALRYRVLREPLGLTFTLEQLAAEATDTHVALYAGDRLMGVLMLQHQDADTVKMRQVAIVPESQGQGLGRILVTFTENIARQQGYKTVRLNARETAVPFYARLDYLPVGEPFDEVGLPHLEMRKTL
jgi:predicted GNAT family N-acyltransferase